MGFLIPGACVVTSIAAIIILFGLFTGNSFVLKRLSLISLFFLVVAGVLSGLLSLVCLAAAAFGMNTRLPWGLGIYMYLMPALSVPAFLVLRFSSVRTLSLVLWFLTVASSFAFYFGDQADRVASGLRPISDPKERLGMFFNAFTLVLIAISVLVQLASICKSRAKHILDGDSVAR
jgi:hypothetical protein